MKKKIVGLVLASMVFGLPFIFNDNQVEASDSCETYTNYYFFSDIASVDSYEKEMVGNTLNHTSREFTSIIPEDARIVSQGQVNLKRTGSSKSTSTWSLSNFWNYYKKVWPDGRDYYKEGNTYYISHGDWYLQGSPESSNHVILTGFTNYQLTNASVLPTKTTAYVSFGTEETNPNGLIGSVRRTYTKNGDDVGSTPLSFADSNNRSYVMPALYYIRYEVCEENENTYQVNEHFKDEDGNKIKDSVMGLFTELRDGATYNVSCPTSIDVDGKDYTLTKTSSNASGTINGSDVDVDCIYSLPTVIPDDDEPTTPTTPTNPIINVSNPQTWDLPMSIVLIVGVSAFIFAIYYLVKFVKKPKRG